MTLTNDQIQALRASAEEKAPQWQTVGWPIGADLADIVAKVPALCAEVLELRAADGNERRQLSEIAKACNYVTTYNKSLSGRVAELAALPDEIDRLRAEVARLREAIRPFAKAAKTYLHSSADDRLTPEWDSGGVLTIGELRRAHVALEGEA